MKISFSYCLITIDNGPGHNEKYALHSPTVPLPHRVISQHLTY